MKKTAGFYFVLIWAICIACSSDPKSNNAKKSYLPPAKGAHNVILTVMDTTTWNGSVGKKIRGIFAQQVVGLPQAEPYFKVRNINPLKLNNILKSAKNMVFVSTLDNNSRQSRRMREYFTDQSLKKISRDTSLFLLHQKNQFANGQEIFHLFGQSEEQLIRHLEENKDKLFNHFYNVENKRVADAIFKVREKAKEKKLAKEHGFTLKLPYGFEIAKSLKDFVWLRILDDEIEKNVFVHYQPYTSKAPFDDIEGFRERVTETYMRDIQKPSIYMTYQDIVPFQIAEVNFNGKYAKETRGLWKLSDISGGGPFVSYMFVEESQKRIYYVEGYVYAPSKDKREPMQEIELILQSFQSTGSKDK